MKMTDFEQDQQPEEAAAAQTEEQKDCPAAETESVAPVTEAAMEASDPAAEATGEEAPSDPGESWDNYKVVDIEGTPEEIAQEAEELAKPKKSMGKTIGILAAALAVVAAIVVACIFLIPRWQEDAAMGEGDVYQRESYTAQNDQELQDRANRTVAKMGDTKLNNGLLQVYYRMQYYNFMQQYGSYAAYYFGLDTSAPLDGQTMSVGEEKGTWQQYFLSGALETWAYFNAMAKEAEAAGLTLSDDVQSQLDSMAEQLETQAATQGYDSAAALLEESFGKGTTMEDYLTYMRSYQLGALYYQQEYAAMTVTDQELSDYYDAHTEDLTAQGVEKNDMPATATVRHILIKPATSGTDDDGKAVSTDADWAEAEKKANALYEQWKSGAATEDSFGEMATEYTEDDGSKTTGGLYENFEPGRMLTEFNDWSFDPARKPGDTGIVKTKYGYHIMYFVKGSEELYWQSYVRELIMEEKTQALTDRVMEAHPYEVNYKLISLTELNKQTQE